MALPVRSGIRLLPTMHPGRVIRVDAAKGMMMAGGWTRDGAVQDQIDDTVNDAVLRARTMLHAGAGAEDCDDCGEAIPDRRRAALPGVRTCVACQAGRDTRPEFSAINRRGSKDSQLR